MNAKPQPNDTAPLAQIINLIKCYSYPNWLTIAARPSYCPRTTRALAPVCEKPKEHYRCPHFIGIAKDLGNDIGLIHCDYQGKREAPS